MSRTSISQSMKILQLGSSSSVEKEILQDLKSDKALLTLCLVKDTASFKDILRPSTVIGYKDNLCLFETPLHIFDQSTYTKEDSLFVDRAHQLKNDSVLFYENFQEASTEGLLGKGAYYTEDKEYIAFDLPIDIQDTSLVEMSFWVKVQAKDSEAIAFQLKALDQDGKKVWEDNRRDYEMGRFEIYQSWARMYHTRKLSPEVKRLQLRIFNKYHYLDEILCTLEGYAPFRQGEGNTHFLGHRIIEVEE